LSDINFSENEIAELVSATAPQREEPGGTYSDICTRLYPTAVPLVFPEWHISYRHQSSFMGLKNVVGTIQSQTQ